jgi:Flp pilus assembly protein TadB
MLRKKMPGQTGHYKIRYGVPVAMIGIIVSVLLLSAAKMIELRNVAILIATGLIVYLVQVKLKKKNRYNDNTLPGES